MSDTQLKWPCEVTGAGFVSPCYALDGASQPHAPRGSGVFVAELMDKNWKRTRDLYSLRSGDHRKKGIAMNFCPFCGTQLRPASELISEPAP